MGAGAAQGSHGSDRCLSLSNKRTMGDHGGLYQTLHSEGGYGVMPPVEQVSSHGQEAVKPPEGSWVGGRASSSDLVVVSGMAHFSHVSHGTMMISHVAVVAAGWAPVL